MLTKKKNSFPVYCNFFAILLFLPFVLSRKILPIVQHKSNENSFKFFRNGKTFYPLIKNIATSFLKNKNSESHLKSQKNTNYVKFQEFSNSSNFPLGVFYLRKEILKRVYNIVCCINEFSVFRMLKSAFLDDLTNLWRLRTMVS